MERIDNKIGKEESTPREDSADFALDDGEVGVPAREGRVGGDVAAHESHS